MKVKILNASHGLAILKYLEALGYKPTVAAKAMNVTNADEYFKKWPLKEGSIVGITLSELAYTSWNDGRGLDDIVPEGLFFEKARKLLITIVKLNNEYSAEITQDGIKVGCQIFAFEAFNRLERAVKEFKGR